MGNGLQRPCHCQWCSRLIHPEQTVEWVDALLMHADRVDGSYSCADSYRLYCKYIREDNLDALNRLIKERPHTHPG